jgi:hypothetical protein
MSKHKVLASLLSLALTACSQNITGTSEQMCRSWETIRPSRHDVMSKGTVEQIVGNNAARQVWCEVPPQFASWKARS